MSVILTSKPFSKVKTQKIVNKFFHDGFVHIPNILTSGEIKALIDKTDELMDDPDIQTKFNPELGDPRYVQLYKHNITGKKLPLILRNCIELDEIYRDMLLREPIFSLAEAVVGKNSKFCGANVLRNTPGLSIDHWHTDSRAAYFPLPKHIKRHDPKIHMPVMWFTVQFPLTDTESIEYGPTEYVPESHYSGRIPPKGKSVTFDGNKPVSVFAKAGDVYLHDPMCWHRGAPNTSTRTRYLFQTQYAVNWAYTRFGLYNRVPVAKNELAKSSVQMLNLLGRGKAKPTL